MRIAAVISMYTEEEKKRIIELFEEKKVFFDEHRNIQVALFNTEIPDEARRTAALTLIAENIFKDTQPPKKSPSIS